MKILRRKKWQLSITIDTSKNKINNKKKLINKQQQQQKHYFGGS